MIRKKTWIFVVSAALLLFIQFIPIDRSNPSETAEFAAPRELTDILRRSCYDCHSNETIWPWYSRIAPVSWLVAHDVHEGREHLNFSIWDGYSEEKKAKLRKEIQEEAREGEMPPFQYSSIHPAARLNERDKRVLGDWIEGESKYMGDAR